MAVIELHRMGNPRLGQTPYILIYLFFGWRPRPTPDQVWALDVEGTDHWERMR